MAVHYGLSQDGFAGLCGDTEEPRRTAMRMVDCTWCLNICERIINDTVDWRHKNPAWGVPTPGPPKKKKSREVKRLESQVEALVNDID